MLMVSPPAQLCQSGQSGHSGQIVLVISVTLSRSTNVQVNSTNLPVSALVILVNLINLFSVVIRSGHSFCHLSSCLGQLMSSQSGQSSQLVQSHWSFLSFYKSQLKHWSFLSLCQD